MKNRVIKIVPIETVFTEKNLKVKKTQLFLSKKRFSKDKLVSTNRKRRNVNSLDLAKKRIQKISKNLERFKKVSFAFLHSMLNKCMRVFFFRTPYLLAMYITSFLCT